MKRKRPFLVNLLFLTAITVLVWIAVEIVTGLMRKPDPVLPAEILAPIDPTLDSGILNKLQQREQTSI